MAGQRSRSGQRRRNRSRILGAPLRLGKPARRYRTRRLIPPKQSHDALCEGGHSVPTGFEPTANLSATCSAEARRAKAKGGLSLRIQPRDLDHSHFLIHESARAAAVLAYLMVDPRKNRLIRDATRLAPCECMNINQGNIVYILRSDSHPDRYYTGLTDNVERRLAVFSKRRFV
jgi:hypothetical protein